MSELIAFSMIALLLVLSPGPNSVLILKTVGSKGKHAGIENILGLVSATFFHGAISILGLSAIILQSAVAFTVIKYLGAAYLFYLGIKTLISSFRPALSDSMKTVEQSKSKSTFHRNFAEGFLTQLLNPKVSMFYLAAFPQFIDFGAANYQQAFLLVGIHASIIFFWFLGMTLFIEKVKQTAGQSSVGLWVQRACGGLLVYFSGLLVTQESTR